MQDTIELASPGDRYRFGLFEFDARALELRKEGRVVRVRPQSLKLLRLLVATSGDVVPRDEIQQALWGQDTFVDFEQGVNHAIRELRSALRDSAESPRFIQTLARRGYRFIAPVERVASADRRPVLVPRPPEPADPAPVQDAIDSPERARPATTPQGRGDRRWILAAGLLLAGVTVLALAGLFRSRGGDPFASAPTIAVVPFTSPGADASLGAGLAVAIATRLGGQQRAAVRWAPAAPSDRSSPIAGPRPT